MPEEGGEFLWFVLRATAGHCVCTFSLFWLVILVNALKQCTLFQAVFMGLSFHDTGLREVHLPRTAQNYGSMSASVPFGPLAFLKSLCGEGGCVGN